MHYNKKKHYKKKNLEKTHFLPAKSLMGIMLSLLSVHFRCMLLVYIIVFFIKIDTTKVSRNLR